MSEQGRCSICNDKAKNTWVAARHLEGYSATAMEDMSRNIASPVTKMKRETISRHLRRDVGVSPEEFKPEEVKAVAATVEAPAGTAPDDVAVLVQQEVVRKLKAGEGRVTVQHGLQAQQLLDRRTERAKDREVAVTLARLLHAAAPPPEVIRARPVDAIEGEVVVVTPDGN